MENTGRNLIAESGLPAFFKLADAGAGGLDAPENRLGDALRARVRALSGFQKEALIRSARTGDTWRLVSDEGPYLNGLDAAPCPLAFLTAGMAASYLGEIAALAERRGVALRKLRLIQNNFYTMKGSMPKRTMVGGAENVELEVEIDCDLSGRDLQAFLLDATYASPLNGLMRGRLPSLFKLARNGSALRPGKAAELDAPLLPDPAPVFGGLVPEASPLPLLEKAGPTPKKPVPLGTSAQGSSLTDEQDRRLNVAAIAELRPDGIKEIRQLLYSPHGTSFRFLSSEDGRAPDAATLISAGIGFCFMTQFGRFVSMLGLDLPGYRIAQDTHFSLGGASGGTGRPGAAAPVETHVFLDTSEPEAVAREMLDIAEQTCFLHAFCRTDLKTRLKVRRL